MVRLAARKPPGLTTAIEQLIDAETVERRVRSIQYQMRIAKFPHHKDFATFDYGAAAVTRARIQPFCSGQFTEEAHNLILVGKTGTGKTHIAIAPGTTLINNGKKARFFNAVDLINALIKEQADGDAGKIIRKLSALDCVTHHCNIVETGNRSYRFAQSRAEQTPCRKTTATQTRPQTDPPHEGGPPGGFAIRKAGQDKMLKPGRF